MYHPDKTDNELLKAKFNDIKEAYEVLSDHARRKKYDLTFDNFSYRKEEKLTPYQLLQSIQKLRSKNGKLDPNRMDLDRLEFEITELLSERNKETLAKTEDTAITQSFISELLETAKPLSSKQFKPISEQILPLADDKMKEKIRLFLQSHTWENRWNDYKVFFAIVAGIILCFIIYLFGK